MGTLRSAAAGWVFELAGRFMLRASGETPGSAESSASPGTYRSAYQCIDLQEPAGSALRSSPWTGSQHRCQIAESARRLRPGAARMIGHILTNRVLSPRGDADGAEQLSRPVDRIS